MVLPSTAKPTSALDDTSNRCLFACPYHFNPVCGSDGMGSRPQLFANGCFMMAYSCETRRGEWGWRSSALRDYCLLYDKIMHNCLSIYSSSCVSFSPLLTRIPTRGWKPVHGDGERICRHIISVGKEPQKWHKWKINWVLIRMDWMTPVYP